MDILWHVVDQTLKAFLLSRVAFSALWWALNQLQPHLHNVEGILRGPKHRYVFAKNPCAFVAIFFFRDGDLWSCIFRIRFSFSYHPFAWICFVFATASSFPNQIASERPTFFSAHQVTNHGLDGATKLKAQTFATTNLECFFLYNRDVCRDFLLHSIFAELTSSSRCPCRPQGRLPPDARGC